MDHLVETLEEATTVQVQGKHQQQQLVRIKAAAELGLQARSSRGRALGGRVVVVAPPTPEEEVASAGSKRRQARPSSAAPMEEGGDDGDEEEVEEKVALLRQLVPGGEGMPVEGLLEETAGYIAALKAQVGVMRALACLLSGSGAGLDALTLPEEPAGILTLEKPV